jgi:hypothetical protein
MKKLLIATNIMLLVIISFMACNSNQQNSSKTTAINQTSSCMDRFCKRYPVEYLNSSRIRADLIAEMSDSFANDLGKGYITGSGSIVVDGGGHSTAKIAANGMTRDALSVVFDLEKIKTLAWLMDSAFCAGNCPDKEMGIRFYYVKYPSTLETQKSPDELNGLKATERNKHSLVMVPVYRTKNMPNAEWYDFNLWPLKAGCFTRIYLGNSEFPAYGIGPNPGDNHGGIGPPPDPGTFPTSEQ